MSTCVMARNAHGQENGAQACVVQLAIPPCAMARNPHGREICAACSAQGMPTCPMVRDPLHPELWAQAIVVQPALAMCARKESIPRGERKREKRARATWFRARCPFGGTSCAQAHRSTQVLSVSPQRVLVPFWHLPKLPGPVHRVELLMGGCPVPFVCLASPCPPSPRNTVSLASLGAAGGDSPIPGIADSP